MEEYRSDETPEDQSEKSTQAVKEKVVHKMEVAWGRAGEAVSRIRDGSLIDLYKDTKAYVRDYPGPSLLVALAVGYLMGVVFRRRQ